MQATRTSRRVGFWVLMVAMSLSLFGCAAAPKLSPDELAVRTTIERYNTLLIQGHKSLDMNPMQEVATKLQAEDEYIYMSSLAEGGVRLDAQLKDQQFLRVSVESTSAQAETLETWDYRHYARDSGKLVREQKDLVYRLAWDLERQSDGRWLVSDVRAIDTTAGPPSFEDTSAASPMGKK